MNRTSPAFLLLALSAFPSAALAKLSVLATTTDLRAIVAEVGKDLVSVESIAKGTQDPHYIEAKPSFMVKASRAELVVANGLDLEVGWLPSIVRGARNPKIASGEKGYLEVGPSVSPLEVPQGKVTRAEGDVHPFGNPHVTLDPIRAGEIAGVIATRLGEIDAPNAAAYSANAVAFQKRLKEKTSAWQARIEKSGTKDAITYHKTLTYFLDRFKIGNPAILEPKPGVPPTSGHVMEVIRIIREKKVPLILVENFFDPTVTNKIRQEIPAVRAATVPVAVDGAPGTPTIDDLYETLVKAVEGK
jgi:zinc/manganese transport system substrate-binding protein